MNGKPRFEVNYLPEAEAFIMELDEKTRRKVLYNITLASIAFWDKQKKAVVVATHGIFKKTQKTPKKEIDRAKELMKSYLK